MLKIAIMKKKLLLFRSMGTLRGVSTIFVALLISSTFVASSSAQDSQKMNSIGLLPEIIRMPTYEKGTGIYFLDQNPEEARFMHEILSMYGGAKNVLIDPESGRSFSILTTKNKFNPPRIEFRKINPTKYRLRIHRIDSSFPLIFSESFHEDWKLYLTRWSEKPLIAIGGSTSSLLASYRIISGNEEAQATLEELEGMLRAGLISDLGAGEEKERQLYRYFNDGRKELVSTETYKINFISKNIGNSIQNDNLPDGEFWETWFEDKLRMKCESINRKDKCQMADINNLVMNYRGSNNVVEWPDIFHWKVNSYANAWWIDLSLIRALISKKDKDSTCCRINDDGSVDVEMIIEFQPQRNVYIGYFISFLTLLLCVIFFIYSKLRKNNAMRKFNAARI